MLRTKLPQEVHCSPTIFDVASSCNDCANYCHLLLSQMANASPHNNNVPYHLVLRFVVVVVAEEEEAGIVQVVVVLRLILAALVGVLVAVAVLFDD